MVALNYILVVAKLYVALKASATELHPSLRDGINLLDYCHLRGHMAFCCYPDRVYGCAYRFLGKAKELVRDSTSVSITNVCGQSVSARK